MAKLRMFRIVWVSGFSFLNRWLIILSQLINGLALRNSRTFKSTNWDSINQIHGFSIYLHLCPLLNFRPESFPLMCVNFQFQNINPIPFISISIHTNITNINQTSTIRKILDIPLIITISIILNQRTGKELTKMKRYSNKAASDHPIFLVDDDSHDSRRPCQTCAQYEQDINLLQSKLMQTHNKLIQQIDICREQEIKLLKLGGRFNNRDGENDNNVGNKQQTGKIFKKPDKSDGEYVHSIQPLIQAKTELLRKDLEAMRAKVLSEILKSNKIKEQSKELQIRHQKELKQYRQKIKKLQVSRNKAIDENQRLLEQISSFKRQEQKVPTQCSCGFEQKYYELDKAFMNQRAVTNQLIEENNRLQNKIHSLYQLKLKSTPQEPQHRQQVYTQPKRKKPMMGKDKYKQEFEATKSLIKKLEEAEQQIRSKNNIKT